MNISNHIHQLIKYAFFGVIATLVHLLTAWILIFFSMASVFIANTFAFFTAFIFSYIFQSLYVFNTAFHFKKFIKFFLVQYGTFLVSYLLSDMVPIVNGYLHTFLIVTIMPFITFIIHKFWTFK